MYIPLNTKNEWLSVVYGSITLNFFVASGHPFAPVIPPQKRNSKKCFLGHPNTRLSVFEATFEYLRIHENPPLFVFNMKDKTRRKEPEKEGSKSQGTQKKDHKVTRPQEEGLG